jgi:hypothetical protein
MFSLYQDFGSQLPLMTRYFPLFSVIFLMIFFGVVFVGIKLLKKPTMNLYLIGIIALVIMLIFAGYWIGMSVLSIIMPLYMVTRNF